MVTRYQYVLVIDGRQEPYVNLTPGSPAGALVRLNRGPRGLVGPLGPGWRAGFGAPTIQEGDLLRSLYLNYNDGAVYEVRAIDPNDRGTFFWSNQSDLTGPSAYDVAVNLGYEGTEQEWIDNIRGFYLADGPDDEPPEGTPDRTFVFERA